MTEPTELFSPALADLIATVRDFLKEARPESGLGYQGQVARYLLDMALREMASGPHLERNSAARIAALLGNAADVSDPIASLCDAIRAGVFDDRRDELLRVMIEDSAERVAIIRPDALAPEHRPRS